MQRRQGTREIAEKPKRVGRVFPKGSGDPIDCFHLNYLAFSTLAAKLCPGEKSTCEACLPGAQES